MTKFFDEDDLIDRLVHEAKTKSRQVVFIVGSPLTAPYDMQPGVLDVDGMVEAIRGEFKDDKNSLSKLDSALATSTQHPYQSAFEFILGRRGPAFANHIIRKAVLNARTSLIEIPTANLQNESALEQLEHEESLWGMSKASESLGKICALYREPFGKTVLTTNFDPLLEISIRRAGGEVFSSMTHGEGSVSQNTGTGTHVAHLHGYWRGSDTLHTPSQLSQPRPQLKSSLISLIRNSLVVIVAYGGWDDVITEALTTAIADESAYPEIIWAFFSKFDQDIEAKNQTLIEKLRPGLSRGRVAFYKGINCHTFFPQLLSSLGTTTDEHRRTEDLQPVIDEVVPFEYKELASLATIKKISAIDAFPKSDVWFGRESELETLFHTRAKVISISGMGGGGKSALASTFMQQFRTKSVEEVIIDWRDCREQSSTIHLAIAGAASRVIGRNISPDDLSQLPINEIISLFISSLSHNKAVFVFDNIDNYVDLEDSSPLYQVKDLIEAVLSSDTLAQFIFTSRPRINIEHSSFQEIQLSGLSKDASKQLFESKNSKVMLTHEFHELYELTNGHPLWVSIIAAQCAATGKAPLVQISEIKSGKGQLPEKAMRATWNALNSKSQSLLRVLAELERPEEPENVEDLSNMRWNQATKALSNLEKMGLIIQKEQEDGKELIDLHPLIRQFVRKEFPKKDRESFINQAITFVEKRLDRFNKLNGATIPFEVLDIWVHKIELLINRQNYEVAIETLERVHLQLQARGLHEEVARLGKRIFSEINWALSISTINKFDAFVSETIHVLVALEGIIEAEKWIKRYADAITGKGGHYINLCEIRAYVNWFEENFEDAVHWGELGVALKKDYDVKTPYDCEHTLSLARRDSGRANEALEFFLEGLTLDECLDGKSESQKNGAYYGNVGRCLYLMNDFSNALKAYRKSAISFDKVQSDAMNQGYLRFWVGETLSQLGRIEDAVFFYITAADKWRSIAPIKIQEVERKINELVSNHPGIMNLLGTPAWRAENRFVEWSRLDSI